MRKNLTYLLMLSGMLRALFSPYAIVRGKTDDQVNTSLIRSIQNLKHAMNQTGYNHAAKRMKTDKIIIILEEEK